MSATVDADRFSTYLGGAPVLNVPGRTFPVDVRYLEDAVEITGYSPSNSPADKMIDLDDDADDDASGSKANSKGGSPSSLSTYSAKTRNTLNQLDEYQIEFDLIVQLMVQIATNASLQAYQRAQASRSTIHQHLATCCYTFSSGK